MNAATKNQTRPTIVDEEAGRFYVTLDGTTNVAGMRPIGPAIVSVRVEQISKPDGGAYRANLIFILDGRETWSTPAKFAEHGVEAFVGRYYRNPVAVEIDVPFFQTVRVNEWEGPLSFGSLRPLDVVLDEADALIAELDDEPDFSDHTHCRHGVFVGDPYGPDYLCGYCEDGISVSEMLAAQALNARVWARAKELVAENVYGSLVAFSRREGLSVGRMGTYLVDGVLAAAECSPPSSFLRAAREELVGASS